MRLLDALKKLFTLKRPPSFRFPPATLPAMMRQIEMTHTVEYSCEEVHRLLDQFSEAVAREEDAAALMPLIQRHLDMCPYCRDEYEALLRILKAPLTS